MKKKEIQQFKVYAAKVSNSIVPVQIQYEAEGGGWYAKNLRTKRTIRIKSAARLRYEMVQSNIDGAWRRKAA